MEILPTDGEYIGYYVERSVRGGLTLFPLNDEQIFEIHIVYGIPLHLFYNNQVDSYGL